MKNGIISHFWELPKTRTSWWAMVLGLSIFPIGPLLGTFAAVGRPMIDRAISEEVGAAAGFGFVILLLFLFVAALVTSIRAYRKGERSWVMWAGLIPSILVGAFLIVMITGELAFPH